MTVLNARNLMGKKWPADTAYVGRNAKIWADSGMSGRPIFGNPFIKVEQTARERTRVINAYRGFLSARLLDPDFAEKFDGLRNKNLVCHCAPRACHGHVMENAGKLRENGQNFDVLHADSLGFVRSMMNVAAELPEGNFRLALRNFAKDARERGSFVYRPMNGPDKSNDWFVDPTKPIDAMLAGNAMREAGRFFDQGRMNAAVEWAMSESFETLGKSLKHEKTLAVKTLPGFDLEL